MGRVRQERSRTGRFGRLAYTLVAFGTGDAGLRACASPALKTCACTAMPGIIGTGTANMKPGGRQLEMWADEDGMHYRILDAGARRWRWPRATGQTARVTLGHGRDGRG